MAMKSDSWFARSVAASSADWTTNQAALELDFASAYLSAWAPILHSICMAMFSDMPSVYLNVYLLVL